MSRVRTKELLMKKKIKEQEIPAILENCYHLYLPSRLFVGSRSVRMQSPSVLRPRGSRSSAVNASSVDPVIVGGVFVLVFPSCWDGVLPSLEAGTWQQGFLQPRFIAKRGKAITPLWYPSIKWVWG